ncbi:MAG: molecular chaperone TorD family protein [Gordonibacter sp.]|nr:molecular chaperone TorD family protein [Gordonibacter sp.]
MENSLPWGTLSEVYGFLGNSLLKPMTQTGRVGIESAFWEAFPDFGDEDTRCVIKALVCYAKEAALLGEDIAVQRSAEEYTRLFIGPPSPAAPPWETFYCREGVTVGFGEATFQMRELLREAGLEVRNENNQYEDHMGIELLYLSTICARIFDNDAKQIDILEVGEFIDFHPLNWIGTFRSRVSGVFPQGYFDCLLGLTEGILRWHRTSINR